jgi:hypothetical protein
MEEVLELIEEESREEGVTVAPPCSERGDPLVA